MTPSSSAPAVRTYLHDQLTATLTPDPLSPRSSLLVCYDVPGPNQPDDIVSVGKIHRRLGVNSLVGGGGAGWLEERYTVEVIVDVYRGGDDAQATYLRASTLVESAISLVRSDPTLGGAVVVAKPVSDLTEVEWDEAHGGYHACATLEFECYQRI
jgi:hypothetical protein